jgi:uncharacterized protein (DUF2252 family)
MLGWSLWALTTAVRLRYCREGSSEIAQRNLAAAGRLAGPKTLPELDNEIVQNITSPDARAATLGRTRNLKMARSAHAYVRGNTLKFYEWLDGLKQGALPDGPPIWICGDCHVGNLGPIANANGRIEVQIRDLDQTVIGNPAHDLIRLGLSLASAARGSDLPGVTTAKMIEQLIDGYEKAFEPDFEEDVDVPEPETVRLVSKRASAASWRTLAQERIEDIDPTIPLGKRFWPITDQERLEIERLFEDKEIKRLATILRSRDDNAFVKLRDVAYWMKGCSSLGRLRYAVLLEVGTKKGRDADYCLMDIKEAAVSAAPHVQNAEMPADQGERVVAGARHLSPFLGKRMRTIQLRGKSAFVRELLPQDLKIEIERLTRQEAVSVARYLAAVVGKAHSRQMDAKTRQKWLDDLRGNRSQNLDAPSWLWSSIVDLLADHEKAYLEHCRKYALENA